MCSLSVHIYEWSSLVVVRGLLIIVGGFEGFDHSDPEKKLLSIIRDKDKKWVEHANKSIW